MLHFFKFSSEVEAPVPASEVYVKRGGKGVPEECPPLRAANAFGWDVPLSFDMAFRQKEGSWTLEGEVELESDWVYTPSVEEGAGAKEGGPQRERGEEEGVSLTQKNAWFWDKDQMLPHVISKDVYPLLRNQVKVSTFLFLYTDPNELLLITDIPNLARPFRVLSALVDADWYPASYPWHCVLDLDPREEEILLKKGTPLCRLMTVRRDSYFAREMMPVEFERFFQRGQEWLARHGRGDPGMLDITRTYVREQQRSRFSVIL